MKDRQFMTLLGLVVAAGLVMGLIAFRVTGSSAGASGTANAAGTKLIGGDPNAPRPSAADEAVAQPPDSPSLAADASSANGEPGLPAKDPPEMQGAGTGDGPETAVNPPPQDTSPSDSAPPSSDSPQ